MSTLETTVVEGPESTRTAWILHGILGSGRNWNGMARRLRRVDPTWRFVLPDLRNHGQTGPLPGPHHLAACAADLDSLPAPSRVIGHSFGGKVALEWARQGGTTDDLWVLDSIPVSQGQEVDSEVMGVLEALFAVSTPSPDRTEVRETLLQAGLSKMLVDWLLTSLESRDGGWEWVYDLPAIREMMASYFAADFGDMLRSFDRFPIHLVRAMNSDRWTPDVLDRLTLGPSVTLHELHDAGHWLHVDNPAGTVALLSP